MRSDRPSTGLPSFVDDEAPRAPAPAPARPYAAPPRAAATEVAALEVEALEQGELEDALERQLVESRTAGEITALDVEPVVEPIAEAEAAGAAPVRASAPAPSTPAAPSYAVPPAAFAPSSSSLRERARKEQLGFGFPPSNRGALEAARAEVLAMLDVLDREDAVANRLRARPAAAKT